MKLPSILWHYARVRFGHRFESPEALRNWQKAQVLGFLRRVASKSPFYRRFFHEFKGGEFRRVPILEKAEMMRHFDEINTVGIRQAEAMELALKAEETRDFTPAIGNVTVGLSSGTSGNRGLFLVSPQERYEWAGTMLAKTLPHGIFHPERIALFLRAGSNLYDTTRSRRIQFEFFDLLKPLEEHLKRLNQYRPTILVAPPSLLRLLAESGEVKFQPEKIYSVAEVLDPLDEKILTKAFGQPPGQIYQCTEGFLGVTCRFETIHLNEDIVYFESEFLDAKMTKFNPVITDFRRTSQPIIRYRMNDILTVKKEPCPCGSVFQAIEKIEGRCDDMCVVMGKHGQPVLVFPDFLTRAVVTASDQIREYKIVQTKLDELEIGLLIEGPGRTTIERAVFEKIQGLMVKLGGKMPVLRFLPYEPPRAGSKLKRVECRLVEGKPELFRRIKLEPFS